MNPSQAMLTLCQEFLDLYQADERYYQMDRLANLINGWELGMDAPYPATAKALDNRIYSMLSTIQQEKLQEMLQETDAECLSDMSLEEVAMFLED